MESYLSVKLSGKSFVTAHVSLINESMYNMYENIPLYPSTSLIRSAILWSPLSEPNTTNSISSR